MLSYVPNHSKHSKTTKVIKWRWIASIWRKNDQKCLVTSQTIQKNSNLQKYSNYNELHRFDVKNIKTTQNYKSDQITMKCMDLTSKWTKILSYVANHSKQRKSTKVIKVQWIASIWCQNDKKCWVTTQTIPNTVKLQKWSNYDELHRFDVKTIKNVELRPKPFERQQNYKSDQITMNCIDLTSKRSKIFSYVANHSKQLKPSKVFKLQRTASIWCQKHQTTQNYKSDQITTKCMDLTSKRTKMLSYIRNHSKQRKSTKVIKVQWIASIWCQNDIKCWVTTQTIPNTVKLQKWSNYDEVHGFDVKTNKNVELRRKPFKTTQI